MPVAQSLLSIRLRETLYSASGHDGVFTMTVPFFTRIHALPEVAQYLYPGGRPRSPEESAAWLQATLESYEQRALAYLAVLRKEDGALIERCGLMD